MTPATYDIAIYQGSTWARQLTWLDDAGDPFNLTGYTARMQVRDQQNSVELLELTTEDGRIALGGAAGTISLTLTAAETAALTWVWGVYDLELVSSGGITTRLIQGRAVVDAEVTR